MRRTLAVLLLALPVWCFASDPLSPRKANYDIKVKFDPAAKTLTGVETITWRHEGENPLATLQFHLYWNAFRDGSTFMRESARDGQGGDTPVPGSMEITSLRLNDDDTELAPTLRYIHPDDENAQDRTVAEIPLDEGQQHRFSMIGFTCYIRLRLFRLSFRADLQRKRNALA